MVTHNPGENCQAVADMALALMLGVARRVGAMGRGMRRGEYEKLREMGKDLYHGTLGIIGLGRIGKATAKRAKKGFDMRVLYHDIVEYADFAAEHGLEMVPLDELLTESDFVSLHVPLDQSTRGLIGPRVLVLMKPGAILINTCRGEVVDEGVLKQALKDGHLFGYGTDVYIQEPPTDPEFLGMENVLSTPHIAGITGGGLFSMAMATARKVVQFLVEGETPENVLNPEVLDRLKTVPR